MAEKLLHNYLIQQVPLARGLSFSSDTPLREVVAAMRKEKVGCVITLGKGNGRTPITGIFTERDLLNKVIDEKINWSAPIQKFTTPSPVTMTEDEPLRKAIFVMRKKNFRHIPIFSADRSKLVGVLSIRNIVKLFAEHFPMEVMNLPPRLHQTPSTPEGG